MRFMKMKIKFSLRNLLLLVLAVLVLSRLGLGVKEFFENAEGSEGASSALPKGISKSEIPEGDEDMYILKSEVVPPVCPKCPDVTSCPKPAKCQPCPPCARCPEPAFECKKVPNYNRTDDQYLPRPVLSDFSQFGM